jgi:glycosyltransferase involved in cell wall biosynthesis
MRVLHVISGIDPKLGGPVAALNGLATAQAAAGLQVSVFATFCAGADVSVVERLRAAGVGVQLVGPCRPRMAAHPRIGPEIERSIITSDVVHIHALWEEVQHRAASSARRQHVPYLIRTCGMLDPWSFSQNRWKKRLYMAWRMRRNLDSASAIHFTTETERDVTRFHHLRAPAIVEPNGVDLEEYGSLPPAHTFRQKHPQLGTRPLIVFVGRIHPGKGVEHLIPALAKMRTSNAALAVVGPDSGGFGAEMATLAERHGVKDRVIFTGHLSGQEKVAALADADLFALPSNHENFGVSVIESLAAGTPVVVSDQVYIHREITSAGVGGSVRLDVDELAQELDRWLIDDELRAGAAARARQFVRDHYSWTSIATRWVAHYERLVAGSVARSPRIARSAVDRDDAR